MKCLRIALAAIGIALVRPRVSAAFQQRRGGTELPGVHGGLVGQEVVTIDRVGGPERAGHVRLAGERWLAVSGGGTAIPAAACARSVSHRGTPASPRPAAAGPEPVTRTARA